MIVQVAEIELSFWRGKHEFKGSRTSKQSCTNRTLEMWSRFSLNQQLSSDQQNTCGDGERKRQNSYWGSPEVGSRSYFQERKKTGAIRWSTQKVIVSVMRSNKARLNVTLVLPKTVPTIILKRLNLFLSNLIVS